jgi:hypothetical protein
VATGLVLNLMLGVLLYRVAGAIRQEQLQGTLESLMATPTATATVQIGSVASTLLMVPLRATLMMGAIAIVFGLGFDPAGIAPAALVMTALVPFAWGLGLATGAAIVTFRRGSGMLGAGTARLRHARRGHGAARRRGLERGAGRRRPADPALRADPGRRDPAVPARPRPRAPPRHAGDVLMGIWDSADALALRSPGLSDLRVHRLHLIAARALRRAGRPVPDELRAEARLAAAVALATPILLDRVRAAYDGTIVLMKGPEVGARYPDPALRPCHDLDLLVGDAIRAQRALRAAGFVPTGDPQRYEGIHHLRPLMLPGLPVTIEVHSRPKWPDRLPAPATDELLEAAYPSTVGTAGIMTLPPAHHAVVLAAHAWAHDPLASAGRLIDVSVMALEADPAEARRARTPLGLPAAVARHVPRGGRAGRGRAPPARHARVGTAPERGARADRAGKPRRAHRRRGVEPAAAAGRRGGGRIARQERHPHTRRAVLAAVGDAFLAKSEHDRRTLALQPAPFEEEKHTV